MPKLNRAESHAIGGLVQDVAALKAGGTVIDTEKIASYDAALAELALIKAAASGDMLFSITPATKSTAAASAANRSVVIKLVNAKGDVHSWYNGTLTVAATKSSSAGTVAADDTTPTMVNGECTVALTIGGTWVKDDTNTLTLSNQTILGQTVTGGTSVETMTA